MKRWIMARTVAVILCLIVVFLATAAGAEGENNYAVGIGINGYSSSLGKLNYCVDDARAVAKQLIRGGKFDRDEVALKSTGK